MITVTEQPMPKSRRGAMHPCTQCELADSANAFLVWFRAFIGKETFAEIECAELTALRTALARANAEHGRGQS